MRRMLALAGLAFGLPWVAWGQAPTSQSAALPAGVERVLKYVPDDTHLLIIVPSMDGLATGVAAFGKAIVLPELAEVNAREMLTEMLGANAAALDTHGALVLALSAAHDEPLLLATLARDEGWKGTTQPTRLDDETLVCEFGPERFLAASTNGVAILAREKSELRRALEARGKGGERCAAALAPCLAQRQVALYVDIPAWKSVIDAQMTLVSQGMYMGMAAAGPDAELGMQVWNWMLEQVKNIVAESRTFVATVRIDAQGVFADGRATFDADGQVVRYLQGVQRPRRDLLRGLPTTTAPVLMAFEWEEAPGAVGPQEAMSRAILRMDAVKEKIDGEKLATVMKQTIEMNRRVPGSSAVFSFSPEERGLLYWGLYLTREGPAVQREMRSIWELTPELVNAWGTFPGALARGEPERIGGVDADVYKFDFDTDAALRQPMLQALYGRDPTLYMAPHPEGLAYAFGPQTEARARLADILDTERPPLRTAARVTSLFKHFSADPQCCLVVDLPAVFRSVSGMLAQFGLPVPAVELKDEQPPLAGATLYLEPESIRTELFAPAEPIKDLVKAIGSLDGGKSEAY
ncbi:MAG TPA: hypothetical protein PLP66_00630 [Phycisphaerae bacterium]|nr:hypothetical protein [Phycisphaerae bacterium]